MAFTVPFKAFNGGEISPDISARTDQAKYQTGLSDCRNFFVRLEGSASNRSGTGYICPLIKFSQGPARLIPFIFNDDQSYQILIHWTGTETRFLVIKNSFPILGSGREVTAVTSATPPVARIPIGHGLADGDLAYISSPEGSVDVGNRWFQAQDTLNPEYVSLWEEAAVNGTGYTFTPTMPVLIKKAYSVAVPGVTAAQIPGLRYTQSADVLTFVHDELPPFNITRLGDSSWTCANVAFDPSIAQPDGGQIAVAAGAVTLRYRVTAVSEDTGEESFPGLMAALLAPTITLLGTSSPYVVAKNAHGYVTGDEVYFDETATTKVNEKSFIITVTGANTFTLNGTNDGGLAVAYVGLGYMARTAITNHNAVFPTAINTAVLTWTAVPNTSGYNIYRETNGVFSYIGTAVGERFEDLGYTADSLNTPPIALDYFNTIGEYPSAVGYYQQRLVLGGPNLNPEEVRASRIGAFYNFTRSQPTQNDDSIKWIMASGQVNQVRHLADMGKLLVFTQGAVFSTEGDDAGTLTPRAINPRKRADYGIGDIRPLTIGQVAIYVQVSGKIVREMEPNSFGVYASRDLTSFAKHLFETGSIVAMSYAEEPFGIIWAVRSDGVMLGLTYLKEHAVDGWHHHDTGDGDRFLDVSCIPESNESATYVLVSRANCNGQTRTYCERMATRSVQGVGESRFLDCYTTHTSDPIVPPVVPIEPPVIPIVPPIPPVAPPSPPVITSPLTISLTEDTAFNYTITATGTGPITYGAPSIPAWVTSVNSVTGQITGTPPNPGTFSITITATNAGGSDTETLVVTVASAIGDMSAVEVLDGIVYRHQIVGNLLYIVGSFTSVKDSIGTITRNRAACLNMATGRWTPFNPNAGGVVRAITVLGGSAYIAGNFTLVGGVAHNSVAKVDSTTGAQNATFTLDASDTFGGVRDACNDGANVYFSGGFTTFGGANREGAVQLTTSGAVTGWRINDGGDRFMTLSGLERIQMGGAGVFFAGTGRVLNSDFTTRMRGFGTADTSTGQVTQMSASSTSLIGALARRPGGGWLIGSQNGGMNSTVEPVGSPITNLTQSVVSISSFGNLGAIAVAANGTSQVAMAAAELSDGSLILGGGFDDIGGNASYRMVAKLTSSGAIDSGFTITNSSASNFCFDIGVYATSVVLMGDFDQLLNGVAKKRLAFVNSATGALY